jgi:hypothetical protein
VATLLHFSGAEVFMAALRSLTSALVWTGVLSVLIPSVSSAQPPLGDGRSLPYDVGFERGQRAGLDDARRGDRYDFTDESDYRRGDAGYRGQYGDRQAYRERFRNGYQAGYRVGYGYDRRPGYAGSPAFERGFNDGYEAGIKDARRRERPDPISEGRYRSADRGYNRNYGSREAYKNQYRTAFRQGYERGYADARRYDGRPGWGVFFGFGR